MLAVAALTNSPSSSGKQPKTETKKRKSCIILFFLNIDLQGLLSFVSYSSSKWNVFEMTQWVGKRCPSFVTDNKPHSVDNSNFVFLEKPSDVIGVI